MLTLGVIYCLFVFWTIIGQAILSLCTPRIGVLRSWFLSPVVGLSFISISLMIGNQAGFPIADFALELSFIVLLLSIIVLYINRPKFPFIQILPFIGILIGATVWIAWPAFKLKFNWISFVTDDYANYCLAADRFKDFGFYRAPTAEELLGKDYSQYFWFMHVPSLIRFGAEHQLAWLSSITKLRSFSVFMPMIVALALVQISATSAIVIYKGRYRQIAILAAALLAISPMFMYGALYELIAQVGGLGLLVGLVAMLTSIIRSKSRVRIFLHAIPTALIAATLAIFYPEVTPFAIIAVCAYILYEFISKRVLPGARVVLYQYVIILFFILLRHNIISYIYTLATQFLGRIGKVDLKLSLFPFFLIPSGFPSLFGLQAITADIIEPYGSVLIVMGFFLFLAATYLGLYNAKKGRPFAFLFVAQFGLAVMMFYSGNDFGLYKMAMFIQPMLVVCLAEYFYLFKNKFLLASLGVGYLALISITGYNYTLSSAGGNGSIPAEVQHVAAAFVYPPKINGNNPYTVSSIDNVVAAKLASGIYKGTAVKYVSREMFLIGGFSSWIGLDWPLMQWYPHPEVYRIGAEMVALRNRDMYVKQTLFGTQFLEAKLNTQPTHYLSLTANRNLFNKIHDEKTNENDFFIINESKSINNLLIFIHSTRGSHYYLGDRKRISYYQQERDFFDPNRMINGIGSFFLLRLEKPTDQIYLRVAATKSVMTSGRTSWSKNAIVMGEKEVSLDLVGDGAINRIVGPVRPIKLGDSNYIALSFEEVARAFPTRRTGLKGLYNKDIPLDYRLLIGFGRDISAMSLNEYSNLDRPKKLESFPRDIVQAKGFEFSGIYEDGWVSSESKYIFGKSNAGDMIELKFNIPSGLARVSGDNRAIITINNQPAVSLDLIEGDYDLLLPIKEAGNLTRLSLQLKKVGFLPLGDDRPVSLKLDSIRIVPSTAVCFSNLGSPRPISTGIDQDGWAKRDVTFDLPVSPKSKEIKLEFEYPGWDSAPKNCEIEVKVDETISRSYTLHAGTNIITVPIISGSSVKHININTNKDMTLPNPDLRQRSYRLISAESI